MNAAQQTIALLLVSLFLAGCIDAATPEAEGQGDTSGTVAGTTVVNNYYAYSNYTNVTTPEPTTYYRSGAPNGTDGAVLTTIRQNSGEWVRLEGGSFGGAKWDCNTGESIQHTATLSWIVGEYQAWGIPGLDCDVTIHAFLGSNAYEWGVAWTVQPVVAG